MGFLSNEFLKSTGFKAIADIEAKAAAAKADADAKAAADAKVVSDKAAQDQKYFDTVQKRTNNIEMQKNAAINAPSAPANVPSAPANVPSAPANVRSTPAKRAKFNFNSQTVNPVINGVATGQNFFKSKYTKMKKGGSVKSKVSTASKRGDGCAIKGKTKGRFV
jgi:uncharacterized protein (DUF885 family)